MLILVENADLVEALRGSEKSTAEKNAKTCFTVQRHIWNVHC